MGIIIGAGNIGATAARLFGAGHRVAVSGQRGPISETLASLVAEIGPRTRAVTVEEAAVIGEVVLETVRSRTTTRVSIIPMLLGSIFFKRYFIQGIASTGMTS